MGTVYSAEDTTLGRRVALKVLPPALSRDERCRERFLRESKIAAGLEHPNVIPIYGAAETDDGLLFLAMRYVDGRDLAAMLKSLGRCVPAECRRRRGNRRRRLGELRLSKARGEDRPEDEPHHLLALASRRSGLRHRDGRGGWRRLGRLARRRNSSLAH